MSLQTSPRQADPQALLESRKAFRFPGTAMTAQPPSADFAAQFTRNDQAVLVISNDLARIVSGNDLACTLLGHPLEVLKALWLREIFPPADADFLLTALRDGPSEARQAVPLRRRDGSIFYAHLDIRHAPLGEHVYALLVFRDIEHPQAVTQALLIRDIALAACANGIAITDMTLPDQPLIYVNPAFERLTGYDAGEILGRNCRFLQGEERQQLACRKIREAIANGQEVVTILRNFRKDGRPFWNELHLSPVRNARGVVTHYVGVQHDVSYMVAYHQEMLGRNPPGMDD